MIINVRKRINNFSEKQEERIMSMYRKNRFGENVDVVSGRCGSCKFYEFEDERYLNRCHEEHCHGNYMYDDHCTRWEESCEVHSTGCFLTTACCQYKGLPDNCWELSVMRKFRDEVLAKSKTGQALISLYYHVAPGIVKRLETNPDREAILESVYKEIVKIAHLACADQEEEAVSRYVKLVYMTEKMV